MLCEECGKNEAVYTVSVIAGEEVRVKHLCEECMAKMNEELRGGSVMNLLSSVLSALGGRSAGDKPAEAPKEDPVCPKCGTSLSGFIKRGRLGCPACYGAFREQLQPMLMQIHGRVVHAGRAPLDTREAQQHRSRQEELTRQMAQAVAEEDFETAAVLRDQLRALADRAADDLTGNTGASV